MDEPWSYRTGLEPVEANKFLTREDLDAMRAKVDGRSLALFERSIEHGWARSTWERDRPVTMEAVYSAMQVFEAAEKARTRERLAAGAVVARPDHPQLASLRATAEDLGFRLVEHPAAPDPPDILFLDLNALADMDELMERVVASFRAQVIRPSRPGEFRGQRPQQIVVDEVADFDREYEGRWP